MNTFLSAIDRVMRRLRIIFSIIFVFSTFAFSGVVHAAPVCGDAIKYDVAKLLETTLTASVDKQFEAQAQLYNQYFYCAENGLQVPTTDSIYSAAKQCGASLSYLGSIYYEEMSCCGYDPQKRAFACPVKIKQMGGFGGSPLPGSREYVYTCVANSLGVLQPVAVDSVHLSNSTYAPSWQFAVIATANMNLPLVQPMSGLPKKARSILSWGMQPTSCTYKPIWGTVLDYTIRLDQ